MPVTRAFPRALRSFQNSSQHIPRSFLHSSVRRRQDEGNSKIRKVATAISDVTATKNQKNGSKNIQGSKKKIDATKMLPKYTEEEYQELKKKYTQKQIEAIKLGEAAVNPGDIIDQGVIKQGPMTLDYVDDFATIRPVIDKKPLAPESNSSANLRFKNEDELAADLGKYMQAWPKDGSPVDPVEWQKFLDKTRLTVGKESAELNPRDYEAPALRKMSDPLVRAQARASKASQEDDEMAPYYARLEKQTGLKLEDIKMLRVKTLVKRRVVNVTRLGKIFSSYQLTVAGNREGMLGIGEGKAREFEDAKRQSIVNAIRNMTPVRRYEERTIYGDSKGKVGATELELFNRPPGMLALSSFS